MYSIRLIYHEQTRRLALDETTVSTGDIDTDQIVLRTTPAVMRGQVINIAFKVRVPTGKGKVSPYLLPLKFDVGTRTWRATIPKEVLQAITRSPTIIQLRMGEGKHYYSLNTVELPVSKAIMTK